MTLLQLQIGLSALTDTTSLLPYSIVVLLGRRFLAQCMWSQNEAFQRYTQTGNPLRKADGTTRSDVSAAFFSSTP